MMLIIIEKRVEGHMRKFLDESSLVGQVFVKNPSVNVAQVLKEQKATVLQFTRFEVGEGIEKVETDFRQEVLAVQAATQKK